VAGLARAAAALYGLAWEARRRGYAAGWLRPRRVAARVVSVGNLTVGGTGKTTLTLHLACAARAAGRDPAVVCRRYRPGPGGRGDEELLLRRGLGGGVFAGADKLRLAEAAARAGHDLVVVDDGFSHWRLVRDLDLVLLDWQDPWGGAALLPAGRLREPRRALQRADWLVLSRVPRGPLDPGRVAAVRRYAPAARLAAGRHRVTGLRRLDGTAVPLEGRVRVVTGTGHPEAVAASAREAGLEVLALSTYPDHHWFTAAQARRELKAAERAGAAVLLSAKDAVRWPAPGAAAARVLEVEWEWVEGGEPLLASLLGRA
jgi:tetraacyldisaccharide 4'-kinase